MYYFVSQAFIDKNSVLSAENPLPVNAWASFLMHIVYFGIIYSITIITIRSFFPEPKIDLSPGVAFDGSDTRADSVLDVVSPRVLIKTNEESVEKKQSKKKKAEKLRDAIN